MKRAVRQQGVAAVEFALIFPIFLLIVFSTIELGIILYDKAVITNASREAARAGIVLRTPKLTSTEIAAVATTYCNNNLLSFAPAAPPSVTVPSGAQGGFGVPLTVTVSYTYQGLGLTKLLSAITGPLVITATSSMRNE